MSMGLSIYYNHHAWVSIWVWFAIIKWSSVYFGLVGSRKKTPCKTNQPSNQHIQISKADFQGGLNVPTWKIVVHFDLNKHELSNSLYIVWFSLLKRTFDGLTHPKIDFYNIISEDFLQIYKSDFWSFMDSYMYIL